MQDARIINRSKIVEIIYKLKSAKSDSNNNISVAIKAIKKIGCDRLAISTILKEINCQNTRFDVTLAFIAKNISTQLMQDEIFAVLNNKNVADRKKVFLINVLREAGVKMSYAESSKYISNPDNVVDLETELFIKMSKINPEAQIDFLDFFFTISDEDKKLLLNSIEEDFKGDELANIIEPVIYYNPSGDYISKCIELLKISKSYLAKLALEYIYDGENNSPWANEAKKAHSELVLQGLRENPARGELFKEQLSNTMPLGFWASLVDGLDNFSLIFARQKADKSIAAFFTVINLNFGINTCFGFDNISIEEFKSILKRFFNASYIITLEEPFAAKLLADYTELSRKKKYKVPYEFLCWRNYIADIDTQNVDIEKVMHKDLKKIPLDDKKFKLLFKKNITNTWFFKKNDNEQFDNLMNKIIKKNHAIIEIEASYKEFIPKIFKDKIFDKKLLMEAYFLKKINMDNSANILYSLIYEEEYKNKLKEQILQKSIYHYFLQIREEINSKENVFKLKAAENNTVDAEYFIKLIEEKWTK